MPARYIIFKSNIFKVFNLVNKYILLFILSQQVRLHTNIILSGTICTHLDFKSMEDFSKGLQFCQKNFKKELVLQIY